MLYTTKCPSCGKILSYSDKLAGTQSICPACGSPILLHAETPAPDSQPSADDSIPPAVEESLLTHQAAAAAGESHVDIEESDLVQWTQPNQPTPPPVGAPPVWSPPPISGLAPPLPPDETPWFTPQAGPGVKRIVPEKKSSPLPLLVGAAIVAALALVGGLIYFFTQAQTVSDWEKTNRDDLLQMKQQAEDLAMQGRTREAVEKYDELETKIGDHQIVDPDLRADFQKALDDKDRLYKQLTSGGAVPETQPAASEPIVPASEPAVATLAAFKKFLRLSLFILVFTPGFSLNSRVLQPKFAATTFSSSPVCHPERSEGSAFAAMRNKATN